MVFKVMGFDAIKEEETVDRDGQRRQAEMRERRREEMGRGKGGEEGEGEGRAAGAQNDPVHSFTKPSLVCVVCQALERRWWVQLPP